MSQTVTDALNRIRGKIEGKSRENRKFHARPKTPAEIAASDLDDDSTHVECSTGSGIRVHSVSNAEVEAQDIVQVATAIPDAVLKADMKLRQIVRGSAGAVKDGHEFVALAVSDLDYLVRAAEKGIASSPAEIKP